MPNDTNRVEEIVNDIRERCATKYSFTVFNIDVSRPKVNGDIVLSGEVLTPKQLSELKREINSLDVQSEIQYNINVLTDPKTVGDMHRYGIAVKNTVNVRRDVTGDSITGEGSAGEGFTGECFTGEKLSTQISPDDRPFKIILRNSGKSLILLDDLTLGWVDDGEITTLEPQSEDLWSDIKRLKRGELVTVDDLAAIFDEADVLVDRVKYLHGGKSDEGVDCSALMQILFMGAYGITIPRHTLDQMKCGLRVPKGGVKAGDLIFARRRERGILHVGLAQHDTELKVIHSCLRLNRVIKEGIDSFYEHYTFAGARRVVEEGVSE